MNKKENGYNWKYVSLGGVTRVAITSGEDIAHLDELDQKKWTVLSCPVKGLEFDEKTLGMIDTDGDGKIRATEVVAAAKWLTSVIKDKNALLKGESVLPLDQINDADETGARLKGSARQILDNLGLEKDSIAIEDTADSVAIFAKTKFNGDGIVTPASTDDEDLKKTIESIIATAGSVTDRSGEAGVNAELVEKFYASCADYSAWQTAAEADKDNVFPFGADTEAALGACEAVKDKVADFFMRCKLINFDADVAGAVDVSPEKIGAISDKNLSTCADEIAAYPLARPSADRKLPFDAINPAWQGAFASLKSLVLDKELAGKDSMEEAEWNAILGKFGAFTAWKDAKKGAEVESLGLEAVNAAIKADRKADILALIDEDNAKKSESESIDEVCKLSFLYRDFYKLLNNYITFTDFYGRNPEKKAIFEAGKLFIDERCCDLCIRVEDMGKHGDMAAQSNMFLIYCACTSQKLGKSMNIAAVMTAGNTRDLRPGKNGIFYDLEGNDWDATIINVVDNPISVKQAFWAPYRKFANFISDKINKSAAEKDSNATAMLQAKAEGGEKQPFDVSKFASIFAIVGVAFAAIAAAFAAVIAAVKGLAWWKWLIIIAAVIIVISGPACFIAWRKLRKRNLGPILNANGWAVNSLVLVNILFGNTLTSVAKYPVAKGKDPFKPSATKKVIAWIIALLIVAFGALYLTDNLGWMGIHKAKKAVEEPVAVEELVETEAADAAEAEPAVEIEAAETAE